MVSDGVPNVSLPSFSKKNRTNRLTKLKQCKLDARREQWLSQSQQESNSVQVRNKGCKLEPTRKVQHFVSSMKVPDKQALSPACYRTESGIEKEHKDLGGHNCNLDSLTNDPILSGLGHKNSGLDPRSSCSSSSATVGPNSGNVSEEEEDSCLDNWETFADALLADCSLYNSDSQTNTKYEAKSEIGDVQESYSYDTANPSTLGQGRLYGSGTNRQAWRPDDVSRPQTLPCIKNQRSLSLGLDQGSDHGTITSTFQCMMSQPSSCPICCEDLDSTDSSFLPCSCGFRLCLFCHKRILEDDARCPGCRKSYDSTNGNTGFSERVLPLGMARPCSI